MLKATFASDKQILEIGKYSLPLYTIDNGVLLLGEDGIKAILGIVQDQRDWLAEFLETSPIAKYCSPEIIGQLKTPIALKLSRDSKETIRAYHATIILDICHAVLQARQMGKKVPLRLVKSAESIINTLKIAMLIIDPPVNQKLSFGNILGEIANVPYPPKES